MDLFTSPAQAMADGVLVALPYLIMIVLMVATQYVNSGMPVMARSVRPASLVPGAAGDTKIMPLHRIHILELPPPG